MHICDRCGSGTTNQQLRDYAYCDDCIEVFEEVRENEVAVVQRKPPTPSTFPDTLYSVTDNIADEHKTERTQVAGLATGLTYTEKHDCRGVFHNQDLGSLWLLSEYLEAHPGIAADVEQARG